MTGKTEFDWRQYLNRSPEERALVAEMRARLAEILEPYISGSRSLLIAHGAAVLASLQFLSSELDHPMQDKVQLLASVFCMGFCLAAVGAFAGLVAKQSYLSHQWETPFSAGKLELTVCAILLGLSLLLLVLAVGATGFELWQGKING